MPQYGEHILFILVFLFCMGVMATVGIAVLVTLARRKRPAAPAMHIFPVTPDQRAAGQKTLLDFVDEHMASEDIRRRRARFNDKLYDWVRDDPKSQ